MRLGVGITIYRDAKHRGRIALLSRPSTAAIPPINKARQVRHAILKIDISFLLWIPWWKAGGAFDVTYYSVTSRNVPERRLRFRHFDDNQGDVVAQPVVDRKVDRPSMQGVADPVDTRGDSRGHMLANPLVPEEPTVHVAGVG
jgi:hypothetical protein